MLKGKLNYECNYPNPDLLFIEKLIIWRGFNGGGKLLNLLHGKNWSFACRKNTRVYKVVDVR